MQIPPLPETTILMVEVGSTAHGTGIDGGEDHDQLAVVVETPGQLLGLDEHGFKTVMQRTQPEGSRSGPGDIDRTLHSLRRFVRMAAAGNPSILMTMWAPIEYSTPLGVELQALGEAFVGRHVVPRYRGYMQSQACRLLGISGGGHGKRGSGGREDLISEYGYDTKYAMLWRKPGSYIYVVKQDGTLVVANSSQGHIDLAEGGNVLAAGQLGILGDAVVAIDNHSGHYRPSGVNAEAAVIEAFDVQANLQIAPGTYQEVIQR